MTDVGDLASRSAAGPIASPGKKGVRSCTLLHVLLCAHDPVSVQSRFQGDCLQYNNNHSTKSMKEMTTIVHVNHIPVQSLHLLPLV